MAGNIGNAIQKNKPISGAYVVMLKRHLSRLKEAKPEYVTNVISSNSRHEQLKEFASLERITPIIQEIEYLSGYGSFGLDIGKEMHPSDYGVFGYAMMNCKTLMCALRITCEHKNMLSRELSAEFITDNNQIIYKVNAAQTSKELQILIELDFSTAFEFAQRLAGPHKDELHISSVHFSHQSFGPIEHYITRFKCPIYFGATDNRIIIEKEVLDTPVFGANPKVLSALEDKIGTIARRPKNPPDQLKEKVSRYIKGYFGNELPLAQKAANHFHMSLSAFKKRLQHEHSCYQNICDEVRYNRCRELMQENTFTMKQIAFELGFTNASAFNRAFKRWSGESPSCFKKRTNEAGIS